MDSDVSIAKNIDFRLMTVLALMSQRLATLIALPKAVSQAAAALNAGTETAVGDGAKPATEALAAPEPTQSGEKQP